MLRSLALVTSLFVSGCGQIYIAPDVSDQLTQSHVSIVPLTPQTAAQANRSHYHPRTLPAVFFQNAGASVGAATLQKFSPGTIETRLPPVAAQRPYQIGVGDVLVLATPQSATSIEELSGLLAAQNQRQGYTVQDDGAIAVPDVGRVQLAGLDLEAAEAEVFQALVSSQLDPTFSIEVAEFNSKRVTVGGAVKLPQALPITLAPLTLQEAIVTAGGPDVLDPKFATVRLYRNGTSYQLPLEDLAESKVILVASDSIVVDAGFDLDKEQAYFDEQVSLTQLRRDALTEQRSTFESRLDADSVDRDFVYLSGEVTEQGRFPLPFGRHATLADALFAQGGPLPETANPAEIYLLRGQHNNTVTAYHLDARNPVNMINSTKIQLRPNDVIFVSQQPVTRWNRVIQQLVPSLITAGTAAILN